MRYLCCDERRRQVLRDTKDPDTRNPLLNGIDFLEVLDKEAPSEDERQRTLFVHFVNDLPMPLTLTPGNFRLEGGERVRDIGIVSVSGGQQANILTIRVDKPGDFSTYTLRLIDAAIPTKPPQGYDPQTAAIQFSFKVECFSDFDCQPRRACPPEVTPTPEIDYLAKDYASFRRLMLDRIAHLMPEWRERSAADLGVTLVELLAYVADRLSYQQDAIATEAYLGTARRRVSVRRHVRLIDYRMHDGCNARCFVQIQVSTDLVRARPDDPIVPAGTKLATRIFGQPVPLPDNPEVFRRAQAVFETIHPVYDLYSDHNELPFYTWSDRGCCLPRGATSATLKKHCPHLHVGDWLIFQERIGPCSGLADEADPTHRHAVRLTEVRAFDDQGQPLTDPLTSQKITEIRWADDDALPFPLCISARADEAHGGQWLEDVSVARGNVVLADHGLSIEEMAEQPVPEPIYRLAPEPDDGDSCVSRPLDPCVPRPPGPVFPRYRPALRERPLTQAAPYDANTSARAALTVDPRDAVPVIRAESQLKGQHGSWEPRHDLLNSGPDDVHFVVEVESDGTAILRFGDGVHGRRPEPGTLFTFHYRVGNGAAGNLGAETLYHIAHADSAIVGVCNLLPARGGIEPETIESARQFAPEAFRTQERAVTESDYAEVAQRDPRVQRAMATFRWTGSWHTVFLTVDRLGGLDVDSAFRAVLRGSVERFRLAGYDLEIDAPRFVPLEIAMDVWAAPGYFRSRIRAVLLEVFSNWVLPDGRLGMFHPDRFTFGQTIYLSPFIAAAQAVPGVASVQITTFQRQYAPSPKPLQDGRLVLDRLEIARLDNDLSLPERGVFRLTVGGGK